MKTLALFLMVIDHIGMYLLPEAEILRAVGRLSAPIWLFLIGFSKTREVPIAWFVWLGIDMAVAAALGLEPRPNILLVMALVRLSLDAVGMLIYPRTQFALAFCVFAMAMAPLSTQFMDYGTLGFLLATIGYWARQDGSAGVTWMGALLFGYFGIESMQFHFSESSMMIFAGGLICLLPLLACFNPKAEIKLSSGWIAAIYRFCGHHSLIFYGVHLILFKILWFFVH